MGELRRVRVRVRGSRRSGTKRVLPRHYKTRRKVQLVALTILGTLLTLAVSWYAVGRYATGSSTAVTQDDPS